jgi:hypothetical protein
MEQLATVDVALPVVGRPGEALEAVDVGTGETARVPWPSDLGRAIQKMGLQESLGYIRLLRVRPAGRIDPKPWAQPDGNPRN